MQVGRLGETQQFFKCKNSAILCKVNAKECKKCKKSYFWSSLEMQTSDLFRFAELVSASYRLSVFTTFW